MKMPNAQNAKSLIHKIVMQTDSDCTHLTTGVVNRFGFIYHCDYIHDTVIYHFDAMCST